MEQANNIHDFIRQAGVVGAKDTAIHFRHKYKWTLEERLIMIIGSIVVIGLMTLDLTGFYSTWHVAVSAELLTFFSRTLVGIAALFVIWGGILGVKRKKASVLHATYHEESTELAVEGNGYKASQNHGPLRGITGMNIKRIKGNDVLHVHYKSGGRPFQIPQRIAAQPGLREIITAAILEDTTFGQKPEIAEWVEGLKTYNR